MIEETVPEALANERIDRVVAFITGCTRSEATALIAAGGARRNGRAVKKGSERVAVDDVVLIDDDAFVDKPLPQPDSSVSVDVVYEDDDVLVVNKPAGLVVHPGSGTTAHTLVNGLLAAYPDIAGVGEDDRPGIVHRIDKGTSGLLMVARNEAARASLSDQLAHRSVERMYLAVVWGHIDSDQGIIDAPLGRDRRLATRMAVVADGRDARTGYEVVRRASEPADVTVVECRLETGRTHQIRVHMAAIGHPIVGDETYRGARDAIVFGRPALHAAVLGFEHPVTDQFLRFEVPPPPDMATLLAQLTK